VGQGRLIICFLSDQCDGLLWVGGVAT